MSFLAATSGVGALVGTTAVIGQPGWLPTASAFVAWSALATVGVFFPRLEMFGRILCHGPQGRGEVALTFDDGPHPITTRQVLKALAGAHHRATFFVLGDKARRHPEVLREIVAQGHELGIHGDTHDRMHSFRTSGRVQREIARAQDAVEQAVGVRPRWFRPPIGHTSPLTMRGVQRAGVTPVGWSARAYDGLKGCTAEDVLRRIEASLDDGAIVLLHDAAEFDDFAPACVGAMPALLQLLDERRLQSVRLDQWFSGGRAPSASADAMSAAP